MVRVVLTSQDLTPPQWRMSKIKRYIQRQEDSWLQYKVPGIDFSSKRGSRMSVGVNVGIASGLELRVCCNVYLDVINAI